jgi:thymidine kinase
MFAGKTTELIRFAERQACAKKRTLVIKYAADTRYGDDAAIKAHNQLAIRACPLSQLMDLPAEALEGVDAIAIDEGQFFEDLVAFAEREAAAGRRIVVAALNGDADQRPWTAVAHLTPKADDIRMLFGVCMRCGSDRAAFTIRLAPAVAAENAVDIGGAEKYACVCRACLSSSSI